MAYLWMSSRRVCAPGTKGSKGSQVGSNAQWPWTGAPQCTGTCWRPARCHFGPGRRRGFISRWSSSEWEGACCNRKVRGVIRWCLWKVRAEKCWCGNWLLNYAHNLCVESNSPKLCRSAPSPYSSMFLSETLNAWWILTFQPRHLHRPYYYMAATSPHLQRNQVSQSSPNHHHPVTSWMSHGALSHLLGRWLGSHHLICLSSLHYRWCWCAMKKLQINLIVYKVVIGVNHLRKALTWANCLFNPYFK